jgi:hypothetical protein
MLVDPSGLVVVTQVETHRTDAPRLRRYRRPLRTDL